MIASVLVSLRVALKRGRDLALLVPAQVAALHNVVENALVSKDLEEDTLFYFGAR